MSETVSWISTLFIISDLFNIGQKLEFFVRQNCLSEIVGIVIITVRIGCLLTYLVITRSPEQQRVLDDDSATQKLARYGTMGSRLSVYSAFLCETFWKSIAEPLDKFRSSCEAPCSYFFSNIDYKKGPHDCV